MALPPAVTIVIATYNRPAMLQVMVYSVLASAERVPNPVRVLVVDDASETMDAQEIAKVPSVDYLRLPQNLGVAGALHAGFEQVDTPYYALWGDDDLFLPNWFLLHLAKIEEGFDVVAGSYWIADADLNPTDRITLPVATFDDLRRGIVMCNDGALVRRDSIVHAFRPERERAMMMTFWLGMAAAGRKFAVVEEPTWLYRRHKGQLSERRPRPHDMQLRREAMAEYA